MFVQIRYFKLCIVYAFVDVFIREWRKMRMKHQNCFFRLQNLTTKRPTNIYRCKIQQKMKRTNTCMCETKCKMQLVKMVEWLMRSSKMVIAFIVHNTNSNNTHPYLNGHIKILRTCGWIAVCNLQSQICESHRIHDEKHHANCKI